ncbi:hypothetical protein FGB62_139g23 [Gracilaria domingensis]|nr:hypothetical protein FGB62_139g23 [Gracilaria domingensis]
MTAESCLGYLIRKTRDHEHLAHLTTAVVAAANSSHLDAQQQKCAANGLGTSLSEAIRLPSGRLHSRGTVIVTAAFQELVNHSEPIGGTTTVDPCFGVLSTCFASLCRYVANEKDARAVTASYMPASKLESLRIWLDESRIVFESLCAMCSVSRHSLSAFLQKVARSSISPLLAKIAESGAPQSVRAALYVALDLYRDEWDFSRLMALEHGVANLCDRVAQIDHEEDVHSPDIRRAQVSIPAFSSALSFVAVHDRLRG